VKLFLKGSRDRKNAWILTNMELIKAVKNGNIEQVNVLITNGVNINAQDDRGWTSLHRALCHDYFDIAKILIESGADLDIKDNDPGEGWAPLHWASLKNCVEILEILLNRGANINIQNYEGDTPLHFASYHRHAEIVKSLLNRGANVNIPNNINWIPMHWEVCHNSLEMVELMLMAGVNVNIITKSGQTFFDMMALTKNIDERIITIITDHMNKPDVKFAGRKK